jgi:hypothetical protein
MKTVKLFPVIILCLSLLSCTNEIPYEIYPLYDTSVPDIEKCTAGVLSQVEKDNVRNYINEVRVKYNLPEVEYDDTKSKIVQEAALIGAANADISSEIVESSDCNCYPKVITESVIQEYLNGNRSLWVSATANWPTYKFHVDEWLTDSTNVTSRLLDPSLKSITFGRVIGTLKKGEAKEYVSSAILITTF